MSKGEKITLAIAAVVIVIYLLANTLPKTTTYTFQNPTSDQ